MSCDCLDTTDHRLIRGITKEVNRIPMVEINLCSQLVNGVVNIGVHDGIPDGYDCILGNDLVPTSNPNFKVAVATSAQSKKIQTSNPNSMDNKLSDDKILCHNFVDKCALGANKNKVVEVSVNPVDDEINLTDILITII